MPAQTRPRSTIFPHDSTSQVSTNTATNTISDMPEDQLLLPAPSRISRASTHASKNDRQLIKASSHVSRATSHARRRGQDLLPAQSTASRTESGVSKGGHDPLLAPLSGSRAPSQTSEGSQHVLPDVQSLTSATPNYIRPDVRSAVSSNREKLVLSKSSSRNDGLALRPYSGSAERPEEGMSFLSDNVRHLSMIDDRMSRTSDRKSGVSRSSRHASGSSRSRALVKAPTLAAPALIPIAEGDEDGDSDSEAAQPSALLTAVVSLLNRPGPASNGVSDLAISALSQNRALQRAATEAAFNQSRTHPATVDAGTRMAVALAEEDLEDSRALTRMKRQSIADDRIGTLHRQDAEDQLEGLRRQGRHEAERREEMAASADRENLARERARMRARAHERRRDDEHRQEEKDRQYAMNVAQNDHEHDVELVDTMGRHMRESPSYMPQRKGLHARMGGGLVEKHRDTYGPEMGHGHVSGWCYEKHRHC